MPGVMYQVNGPFCLYVSGGRVSPANKLALGIARGKGRIRINYHDNPIHADNAGPAVPADVQDMGKDAAITVALSQVDLAVLDLISTSADAPDVGSMPSMGVPLSASGAAFRLHIPSNYRPWTFWTCKMRNRGDEIGSEYSILDLEFYAWAAIGNSLLSRGTKLFSHTF